MSQNWHHTDTHSFYLGWDEPLQGYFLVVYDRHDPSAERDLEPLWSNLDCLDSHPDIFDAFAAVMVHYGAPPSSKLLETLQRDKVQGRRTRHPLADLFKP